MKKILVITIILSLFFGGAYYYWQHNNKYSRYTMGEIYYYGEGVPRDFKKAFECFEKEALQGEPSSQLHLSQMYNRGEGVPKDDSKSLDWLIKATSQGYPEAQFNMGLVCEQFKRPVDAYAYFNLAAATGHKDYVEYRDEFQKKLTAKQIEEGQEMSQVFLRRINK